MKKNYKQVVILVLILLCINIVKGVYATNSEKITVTSWKSLKNVIENNDKTKIEIQLSDEESNTWTADSKISIPSGKTVTLTADSSITIKRGNSFLESMIENKGALDVMTSSNAISLIFDGNKNNVQATGSLINVKGGKLNICNTILQNNNINGYGGAIYASDAELELVNVTLSGNEADFGGAIYVALEESNTNLNNIKIINNKAKTGSGGGIYAYGNLVVSGENTLISNNIAQTFGGGLMVKTAGILNGGEISKNQAISNAGGGIRIDKRFTYNGGIIKENTAGTTGGGIDFTSGILDQKANDVVNNTAKEGGNNVYPILENNVDWTTDGSLKLKKINMKLLKSYVKNVDIEERGTQGMTVTDKYVLFTLWKSDDDTTMIVIADKNTGEILNIVDDYNFKHANDMTYDSKNDYIYILTSSKNIAKFKINAQYQITNLQYVTCNRAYSGIAYDKANDRFIGLCARKIYIINNKFEELSTFNVPTNLTTQGIGYYNGNIYYCCTEMGVPCEYQQIYNNKERLSNLIYKYNLKGELVETLYIPNTDLYGEIESCAFEEDGTLVASYNINFGVKSTVSLYKNNMIPPVLEVSYNSTELTNNDVSVTINSNKELQEVSGWTLSTNKKSLVKTYSKNTQEDIIVKDLYGNSSIAKINITNIDKEKPILDVKYSTTKATNQNVVVTINANEEIKNVEGWTLLEGKKGLTKTYTENKTENIEIIDLAGNISTAVIDINNIDKQKPVVQLKYSETEQTKNDVIVTIIANKEIQEINGWTLATDKKSLIKTYSKNTQEDIIVKDLYGNSSIAKINITNIDKEKPILDVKYSTTKATNQDVVVTIKANEVIKNVEGWTVVEGKQELTKTYTENETENIEIIDLAGNISIAVIDIKNIDKQNPVVQVKYSETEQTLNDVIVTIISNEEIKEIEGWNLSDDKKRLDKTYTKNDEETITIYDLAGNSVVKTIKVDNIDKEKPEYQVEYSTTLITNKDVTVTITANEEIQEIEGWVLSKDKRILTKVYTENTKEEITIKDSAGNITGKTTIKIENIDKIKPTINIIYSETEKTGQDIIVTISANEEIQEVEGWNLSDDKKSLNKTYTKNDEETVTIYDLAGNSVVKTIKVDNIDKEKPQYKVEYSTTLITNKDVTVTITANEEIQKIEGWVLSNDKRILTKIYTENTKEEITIKDRVGNITGKTIIKIENIDKIKPIINKSYSVTEKTNQDVIITIIANEEIKEIEGWSLSKDNKVLTKKFTSNLEEDIIVSDLAGNTISDTIKIDNIDKTAPKIEVMYSTTSITDKDVIVTITSDKIIKEVNGWTLSSDKKKLTKIYKENSKEEVIIIDEAGNEVIATINVQNINKNINQDQDKKEEKEKDDTIVDMIIPNAGAKSILGFIIISVVICIIMRRELKKYKGIK